MVEVGSIQIGGSIDTTMIEAGFRRVKTGMNSMTAYAKSVGSDFQRIAGSAGQLISKLSILGTVSATGMLALAKSAPQIAGSMARIQVATEKLRLVLGEQLQPVFETFATYYEKFVGFVDTHPLFTKIFTLGSVALAGLTAVKGIFSLMGWLLGTTVSATMLSALGYIALIAGAGYSLAKIGEFLSGKVNANIGLGGVSTGDTTITPSFTPGDYASRVGEAISSYFTGRAPSWEWQSPEGLSESIGSGPTPGGAINANTEENRRFVLLRLWDLFFG